MQFYLILSKSKTERVEAEQLAIYKYDRGVEVRSTEKQQLATTVFQVRRPNHSAALPPRATEMTECATSCAEIIDLLQI